MLFRSLEMALDYYGEDRLLFGTDFPFGVMPAGATEEVINSIENMKVSDEVRNKIYRGNAEKLLFNQKIKLY